MLRAICRMAPMAAVTSLMLPKMMLVPRLMITATPMVNSSMTGSSQEDASANSMSMAMITAMTSTGARLLVALSRAWPSTQHS